MVALRWKVSVSWRAAVFLVAMVLLPLAPFGREVVAEQRFAVICAGAPHDAQHYRWYWGATSGMFDVLRKRYGYTKENIYFLFCDDHENDSRVDHVATKANLKRTFAELGERMRPGDTLFGFLVGHGGRAGAGSDYELTDGRLTDEELDALRRAVRAKEQTYVFTPCNSGGFARALGRQVGTIVITSCTVEEKNVAGFAEAIRDALNHAPNSDRDRDGRVSVGEAYNFALVSVRRSYEARNRPLAEHCQIEDNGDGQSGHGLLPTSAHGALALQRFLDEPTKPKTATIKVQYDNKVGEISPLMYGGGFEHVGRAVNLGLDAEMLDGRSFEEDDVNEDGVSDKWLQIGWGDHVPTYDRDGRYSFHAQYCQKITIVGYVDGERGVKQTGLAVTEGKNYTATLHLKRRGRGLVSVSLAAGEKIFVKATINDVSSKWKKYTVCLTPDASSTDAEFRITLAGNGSLWVDQVSLVPEDTYKGHGTRKDIMERILNLSPAIVRWPGGWFAEVYRWKRGIGDVDKRPLVRKYYSDARRRRNPSWEPNHFGTDEFMQFCRDIGAVPLLTVNSAFDTRANVDELLKEAAEWVEYCNGDASTKFGALRAANGHPEPYRVRYWNIGNEVWEMGAENYARRFIRFARAMKEKDPNIKLLAVGGVTADRKWNRTLLRIAGDYIDYIDIHHYESDADYLRSVAMPLKYGELLAELKETIASLAPGRNIKLAVMEWNSNSNWQDASKLKEGLFAAAWLNVLERHSDVVEMAAAWPLLRRVQPYGNHVADHGMIWYDNQRVYVSPTGLAVQLYRQAYAPERVACTVDCGTFGAGDRKNIPYLDAVATRDPGKGLLILKVVNKNPEEAIAADIELKGLPPGRFEGTGAVSTLTGPDVYASNRVDHPHDVHIEKSALQVASPRFACRFPAHSATVLRFQRAID